MALSTTIKNLKKTYQQANKSAAQAIATAIAEAMPDGIKCATWRQYTDYFNDGEQCTFSVHELSVINSDNVEHDAYTDSSVHAKIATTLETLRDRFGDDLCLHAFGDHAEIMIKNNGKYTVNEYSDHD